MRLWFHSVWSRYSDKHSVLLTLNTSRACFVRYCVRAARFFTKVPHSPLVIQHKRLFYFPLVYVSRIESQEMLYFSFEDTQVFLKATQSNF